MGAKVKVIKTEVVVPKQPLHEHWQPLTNLDLVVPPIDVGSFLYYKKSHEQVDFMTMIDALKESLSQALSLFNPLAGEIVSNSSGELEIHCNNKGADFIQANADIELRELSFYNPDKNVEGKLMPERHHRLLAIQVTMLKCGGMVIGFLFDHRVVDGYSINMFVSMWADLTISKPLSLLPNFDRSVFKARDPTFYSNSVANMFVPITDLQSFQNDFLTNFDVDLVSAINRIYYVEGDQIKRVESLANKNGGQWSKLESFTSFLWKITASFLEDSGHLGYMCNLVVPVDGRKRLSRGEGVEKEKLMDAHWGNVVSYPFRGIQSKDLENMSLSSTAKKVHELFESAATKEHFKELIDWVEDHKPKPLISRPFTGNEKAVNIMVSSGLRFPVINKMDFGWGKPVFGSCHVPAERMDYHVMLMASHINKDDWIVYMHLPKNQLNYIEARASHVFKPLTASYLKLVLNPCVARM